MNGFLVALLIGLFGGLSNLLIDIPSLWNHNWVNGIPNYKDLMAAPHRHLHTTLFCLLLSSLVWTSFIAFIYGLGLG